MLNRWLPSHHLFTGADILVCSLFFFFGVLNLLLAAKGNR